MTPQKRSSVFFAEKIGVIPSVAAPGDTHPSDAIVKVTVAKIGRKFQFTHSKTSSGQLAITPVL